MLQDRFGRQITYLRVSVTDRCNFRCVYCMPAGGIGWQPHESIMRFEEIVAVVRAAAENGVRSVRLTGGEPLVRRKLPDLVKMIAAIPGIEDISLTTNAVLLEAAAGPLAEAGLQRINVSIDTLRADRFARITRGASIRSVWRGIAAAERHGLKPIKLNAVVMRGVNDDELPDLARLSVDKAWDVRFIELMPLQNQVPWGDGFPTPEQAYLPVQEMLARLAPLGLEPADRTVGRGPARTYRIPGAQGTVGFISPLGDHFCQSCNRMRLTADGHLRPCLLSDAEIALLPAMRSGEPVLPLLRQAVESKPGGHHLSASLRPDGRTMTQIGG